MPRVRTHKQVDCDCIECRDPSTIPTAGIRALDAVPVPQEQLRSIIIVIEDAIPLHLPEPLADQLSSSFPALSQVCREGCTGLLAVAQPEGNSSSDADSLSLSLQLLRCHVDPSLKRKFRDINVSVLTDSEEITRAAIEVDCATAETLGRSQWQQPRELAQRVIDLVLTPPQQQQQHCYADVAVLSIHSSTLASDHSSTNGYNKTSNGAEAPEGAAVLRWLDNFISASQAVTPSFSRRIIFTLVLGHSHNSTSSELLQQTQTLLQPSTWVLDPAVGSENGGEHPPETLSLPLPLDVAPITRPRQSFQFRGVKQVAVDSARPAIVVHRLQGVIRRDEVTWLNVGNIKEKGAGGCILAEHVLAELAFKLGKAPKYGA